MPVESAMTENVSEIGATASSWACDDDEEIREIGRSPGCGTEAFDVKLGGNTLEDCIPDIGTACECGGDGDAYPDVDGDVLDGKMCW